MAIMKELLEKEILPKVQKPARYLGNEFNALHKEWDNSFLKVALVYPDTYEIGMSNLGLQILYHILNQQDKVLAERAFAPWPDLEQLLVVHKLPLFSLESQHSLKEFDLIGFSLGHELTYSNLITILKLSGIPVWSQQRKEEDPLILGGGPCAFNPEPIADFFDFFLIGEAEEAIIEIVKCLIDQKPKTRDQKLKKLAEIPGVYVPGISKKVTKRYVKDLNLSPYPTKPIVPFVEAIHDRAVLEIMRGCPWGCKFCQAGWTYRPLRERSLQVLSELADELIRNTGYEELSLVSLSSSDYRKIEELAKLLATKYEPQRINISLPSMRTNTFSIKLAREISRVRSSSVTLAPEAGTQRLRDLIGKKMTEEHILEGVKAAFSEGIEAVKLYFMIGLPTETEEDLLGICELAQKIYELGKNYTKRARVTVNLATFIPKPHTPLQWERQISIEETLQKQKFIKQNLKNRKIEVRWHQAEASFLEGVFSRGDRNLAKAIVTAWEKGARFDAWSEHFKFEVWKEAFSQCGIDPNYYLRKRGKDEALPWDFIDTGVPKSTLQKLSLEM